MNSIPTQIGPYEITREIGRGSIGVVYLARDIRLDLDATLKALPPKRAEDQVPSHALNKSRYFINFRATGKNPLLRICEIAVGIGGLTVCGNMFLGILSR